MTDKIRALAVEKVVDLSSLRFHCRFYPLCQRELTYSERGQHVGNCAHGYYTCRHVGCGKSILLTDMQRHPTECEHALLPCHLCGWRVNPLQLGAHLQTYHEAVMFHCPNMARLITPRVFAFPGHMVDWDDMTTNVETIVLFTMPAGVMQSLTVAVRIMVTSGRKEACLQPFVLSMASGRYSYDDVCMVSGIAAISCVRAILHNCSLNPKLVKFQISNSFTKRSPLFSLDQDVLCASESSLILLNPHDASRPFEVCDGIGHSICGKPPRYPVMRGPPPFSGLTVALTEEDCSEAQLFVKVSLGFH